MLLAVDIGNTTISLALVNKRRVQSLMTVLTVESSDKLREDLRQTLKRIGRRRNLIAGVVICSVVPRALAIFLPLVKKIVGARTWVVGSDVVVPIKNKYRYPEQVGQDRLAGAFAAKTLYGSPLIVIDFGTAITLDVVSAKGEYLGGIIVPGIRLTTETLFKKTALLPQVKIEKPKELIGRDTKNSILSGIFHGYGSLCDGLIEKISRSLKSRPKVVATGGYVDTMKLFSKNIRIINRDLIFVGLDLIGQNLGVDG